MVCLGISKIMGITRRSVAPQPGFSSLCTSQDERVAGEDQEVWSKGGKSGAAAWQHPAGITSRLIGRLRGKGVGELENESNQRVLCAGEVAANLPWNQCVWCGVVWGGVEQHAACGAAHMVLVIRQKWEGGGGLWKKMSCECECVCACGRGVGLCEPGTDEMKKRKEGKAEYVFRLRQSCLFFLDTRGLQCDCYHIFCEEEEEDDDRGG